MLRIASSLLVILLAAASCNDTAHEERPIPISLIEIERGQARVNVESPDRGTQTDEEIIEVKGSVEDVDFLKSLTVNDNVVEVSEDGTFTTMISLVDGLNTIEILTDNNDGSRSKDRRNVLKGEFVELNQTIQEAAITTIDQNVLRTMEHTIETSIKETNIMDFVENNLIFGSGGCSNSAWLQGATISDAQINFLPSNDQMTINAEITGVRVNIRARAASDTFLGCIRSTKNGSVSIPKIAVTGRMIADNTNLFGRGARISIPNLNISVPSVGYNISGVPNWLEDSIIGNVQPEVEKALNDSFSSNIPSLIQTELRKYLNLSIPNDIPGVSMSTELTTSAIHFNPSGIQVKTDINFDSGTEINNVLAVFAPLSNEPSEASGQRADVELSLSLDLVNQYLTNMWFHEIFSFEMGQDELDAMGENIPLGLKDFRITPSLPPRVEMKDGMLVMTNADLTINALLNSETPLAAATTTTIELGIEMTEARGFRLIKGDQNTFATVIEGEDAGLTEGLLNTILEISADFFIAKVNTLLEGVELPGNAGLADVLQIESHNQRLNLKGNL